MVLFGYSTRLISDYVSLKFHNASKASQLDPALNLVYATWFDQILFQHVIFNRIQFPLCSDARGQELISTPPLMQFMKQIVPSALALVALKYLVKTESPFLENPGTVWCFVAAFCVYWLTAEAMKRMTTLNHKWIQIASRVALASGILSALSLLSMLLSFPFSLLPIIIWIPLAVILAWPKAYNLFHQGINGVISKIVWDSECNSTEEASLPG